MYLYIEDITLDDLKKFTDKLENLKENENVHIYIASNGGEVSVMEQLKYIINSLDNVDVFVEAVWSCAVDLIMGIRHKLRLFSDTYAICHHSALSLPMITKNKARGKVNQSKLDSLYEILPEYTKFFTEKELEDYKNGLDIYLNIKRVVEMLWDKVLEVQYYGNKKSAYSCTGDDLISPEKPIQS